MGNAPCAHAVDSVLHRRVEIKTHSGHYEERKTPDGGFNDSWWPGAESNHRFKNFPSLALRTAFSRKQTIGTKRKATPKDGFGNDFGNKGVVSLQTLVIPIDLAEEAGFEPAVGY